VPETGAAPCFRVNVVVLIDAGSIASVKVAVSILPIGTPLAPLTGTVELTGFMVVGCPPPPPPLPPPHPAIKRTLRMNITTRQLFRVSNLSIITPPLHFSIVVAEILQCIPPVKIFVFLELVKMI
jgi:hypothetical protein